MQIPVTTSHATILGEYGLIILIFVAASHEAKRIPKFLVKTNGLTNSSTNFEKTTIGNTESYVVQ